MDIFRIAKPEHAKQILHITKFAGDGLTTIPKTESDVNAYIEETTLFFNNDGSANRILFIAERDGQVQGISGIIPKLGIDRSFYSFKRSVHRRRSQNPPLSVNIESLQLSTEFDGYTELASIFLSPKARGKGLGRLLSLGRLCFIHQHQEFNTLLMADIRGWADEEGQSPFWNGLTSKFINLSYEEADRLSSIDGNFIDRLIPSMPIMLNTLPKQVAECSGLPHRYSKGALRLLIEAGFEETDLCDVFDGGPSIRTNFKHTLINKTAYLFARPKRSKFSKNCLHFGGTRDNFMATLGPDDDKTAKAFQRFSPGKHWVAAAFENRARAEIKAITTGKAQNA